MRRQNCTALHVGNVTAAFFMKPNQHAAFFDNLVNRQARPVAITPRFSLYWRQNGFRANAATMPEAIFKNALLGCQLSRGVHMLHRTTATNAKMWASRLDTRIGRFQDADQMGQFVVGLSPKAGIVNRFAR